MYIYLRKKYVNVKYAVMSFHCNSVWVTWCWTTSSVSGKSVYVCVCIYEEGTLSTNCDSVYKHW